MQISFVTSLTGFAVKARVVLGSQSIGTLLCVEKKMVMWAFFFLAGYIYTTKIISFSKGHSVSNTKTGFLKPRSNGLFSFFFSASWQCQSKLSPRRLQGPRSAPDAGKRSKTGKSHFDVSLQKKGAKNRKRQQNHSVYSLPLGTFWISSICMYVVG